MHDSTINSLAPGRFQSNFKLVIFKLILVNGGCGISYEIALRWIPLDLTDVKSTLFQLMAWCVRQQANTWTNVDPDPCRHMAPLGLNELIHTVFCSVLFESVWCSPVDTTRSPLYNGDMAGLGLASCVKWPPVVKFIPGLIYFSFVFLYFLMYFKTATIRIFYGLI